MTTANPITLGQQMLRALTKQAEAAEAFCAERSIDEGVLLSARLYPDMLPLVRQMQIASDFTKRPVSRLAGADAPAQADEETSFAALIARFAETSAWLASIDAAAVEGKNDTPITFPAGPDRNITMPGGEYLTAFALPNLYFHTATAHAILRHNGVALGKRDFLALEP
jgi:uncharacterized protein